MTSNVLSDAREQKPTKTNLRWFRHFYIVSLLGVVIILIVSGFGLRFIHMEFAIYAAKHTAEHISSALSDEVIQDLIISDGILCI